MSAGEVDRREVRKGGRAMWCDRWLWNCCSHTRSGKGVSQVMVMHRR